MSGDSRIDIAYPVSSPNELSDTSGPLFSIYAKIVGDDDNKRVERLQKDAEGIVLFTGLFSAALASLITVSIQDLRPNPTDKSAFYLENIYQLLASTNVSPSVASTSTVVGLPPFSPPRYAIWVNSLWISSLTISITSALLATLIQQWTRRYIDVTQPLGCPQRRARIRQFFFGGDGTLHFMLVTDAVPALLHLSVFLFFAGLLILLRNINHTVFNAVLVWVVLCVAAYAYITFLPIFLPAGLHYSPLSSLAWQFYTYMPCHVFKLLSLIRKGSYNVDSHRPARLLGRVEDKAEEMVLGRSPELDARILESLLDTLGDDHAREIFFEAIPGFYSSLMVQVQDIKKHLSSVFVTKFRLSVDKFLDQTLCSDSISELARSRRLLTCLKATHVVLGDRASTSITDRIIRSGHWNEVPPSAEIGHILRRWRTQNADQGIAVIGSCIIARIIAGARMHDDTSMALAMSQLGVNVTVLKCYLKHGDSVLLANLINTTRLFFEKGLQFQDILRSISGFSVKDILPELQREFCILWNEIVLCIQDRQRKGYSSDSVFILQEIYPVYTALHPTTAIQLAALPAFTGADSLCLEFSYPLCAGPQSHHLPTATYTTISCKGTASPTNEPSTKLDIPHASQRVAPVGTPLRDHPLQRDETNLVSHVVSENPSSLAPLAPLSELTMEVHTDMPPALEPSYSTTTSCTLATPREASVSNPSTPGTFTSTSGPGKGLV